MKTANNCPKCGTKRIQDAELVIFACNTERGTFFNQSDLCRERVKVAKLKKQMKRLKTAYQSSVDETRQELSSLRRVVQPWNLKALEDRADKAEAELAKREMALGYLADACEAKLIPVVTWDNTPAGESIRARRTININAQNAPELAEWLKNREAKS